jgi:hypothetical protein
MRFLLSKFAHLAAVLAIAGCSASSSGTKASDETEGRSFTLFATTELRGNIEPCGCTSDPMGDLARTVAMIGKARAGSDAVLYVDGGSMLYSEPTIPERQQAQEAMKSDLLVSVLGQRLQLAAAGLGPNDLANGPEQVRPPRHAANLPADSKIPTAPPAVVEVGGVKVGLFGVVAPDALAPAGITPTDPVPAAAAAVEQLRAGGAEVVVGLAYMNKKSARALAKATDGIDILVVGRDVPDDPHKVSHEPMQVGTTWLVEPANRGQVVTRLDVTVRGNGPLTDAIGEARAAHDIERIDERLGKLRDQLAEWEKAPDADPSFIATKKKEITELEADKKSLAKNPLRLPDKGSWFVMTQVGIKKKLPCDGKVQARKVELDKKIGAQNIAAAKEITLPEPKDGEAGYVGIEECGYCHAEAVKFWKETKHAGAWETLEKYGKDASYDCVYCHVTGWMKPGGSTIAKNEPMRDVQCEVCHGPGSIHVDEDGKEKPSTMVRTTPKSTCETCHSPEHSDTFDYEAYLRDVTGPGHGEAFRKELGDGPTGHQLRSAALKKAGASIGEGCLK